MAPSRSATYSRRCCRLPASSSAAPTRTPTRRAATSSTCSSWRRRTTTCPRTRCPRSSAPALRHLQVLADLRRVLARLHARIRPARRVQRVPHPGDGAAPALHHAADGDQPRRRRARRRRTRRRSPLSPENGMTKSGSPQVIDITSIGTPTPAGTAFIAYMLSPAGPCAVQAGGVQAAHAHGRRRQGRARQPCSVSWAFLASRRPRSAGVSGTRRTGLRVRSISSAVSLVRRAGHLGRAARPGDHADDPDLSWRRIWASLTGPGAWTRWSRRSSPAPSRWRCCSAAAPRWRGCWRGARCRSRGSGRPACSAPAAAAAGHRAAAGVHGRPVHLDRSSSRTSTCPRPTPSWPW